MGISNLLIYAMVSTNAQVVSIAEVVPEHMRIGRNAPNERVPLARSDITKNWSARAIRKKVETNTSEPTMRLA